MNAQEQEQHRRQYIAEWHEASEQAQSKQEQAAPAAKEPGAEATEDTRPAPMDVDQTEFEALVNLIGTKRADEGDDDYARRREQRRQEVSARYKIRGADATGRTTG